MKILSCPLQKGNNLQLLSSHAENSSYDDSNQYNSPNYNTYDHSSIILSRVLSRTRIRVDGTCCLTADHKVISTTVSWKISRGTLTIFRKFCVLFSTYGK